VLLGQLVEAVTGDTYANLLQARFFGPLGLISTFVEGKQTAPYPVVHSYRFFTSRKSETPTGLWDGTGVGPFRSLATAAGAAGDIASSARDLAVWARALYGGKVLGVDGSKAMLDFGGSLLLRSSIPYGLGVEQFTVAGRTAYGHGGRLMGARSAIRYLPAEGMSIAVVINTDRGDPAVIANALATLALPPIVPPVTVPSPTLPGATPIGLPESRPSIDPTSAPD
jgi:D-alanyl-D-alanine carboxypeptidase